MFGAVDNVSVTLRQNAYFTQNTATRGTSVSSAAPVRESAKASPAAQSSPARSAFSSAMPFGPSELPYVPEGYGPVELATRTRVRFPDLGGQSFVSDASNEDSVEGDAENAAKQALFPGAKDEDAKWDLPGDSDDEDDEEGKVTGAKESKSAADEMQEAKCETCEKRKYQDGSDDPGVSFKNPTRISPRLAQSAVRGHELEHVVRERAKAKMEGRKVVSQSVTYHTAICPECGKMYISGGTTRTVTAADNTSDYLEKLLGDDDGFDITA